MTGGQRWDDDFVPPPFVRDSAGGSVTIGEFVGKGGQGRVYKVPNSNMAVKLCIEDGQDPGEDMGERLARLVWLPLEDIPICRPLRSLAEPHVGYTMEFLADMVAMSALSDPPDTDLASWYLAGGGLRRRLRLLARCADILGLLHGRGIVYGDVSPGNVLVSQAIAHEEVWMIDADNLRVESSPVLRPVGTPFYTAPELIRRQSGNTQFSDLHSFAALAYQTLVSDHPLLGDMVEDGPLEYRLDALRGLLPWVGHRTDTRNQSSVGIKPRQVLTERLWSLFAQTFETGMSDPRDRPRLGVWSSALHAAADRTLICQCRHTFYAWEKACPWCGTGRPKALAVSVREQLPSGFGDRARRPLLLEPHDFLVLQPNEPFTVTARTAYLAADQPDRPVVRMKWDGSDKVRITNAGARSVRRVPAAGGAGRQLFPGGDAEEHLPTAWSLHFGEDRRLHRVIVLPASGQEVN